jgi:hypothetical protein
VRPCGRDVDGKCRSVATLRERNGRAGSANGHRLPTSGWKTHKCGVRTAASAQKPQDLKSDSRASRHLSQASAQTKCRPAIYSKIVKETKAASDPAALIAFFKGLGHAVEGIGIEAGPLSQWLYAGVTQAGFETALLETRHVKATLSAMTVKTDRNDEASVAPRSFERERGFSTNRRRKRRCRLNPAASFLRDVASSCGGRSRYVPSRWGPAAWPAGR